MSEVGSAHCKEATHLERKSGGQEGQEEDAGNVKIFGSFFSRLLIQEAALYLSLRSNTLYCLNNSPKPKDIQIFNVDMNQGKPANTHI